MVVLTPSSVERANLAVFDSYLQTGAGRMRMMGRGRRRMYGGFNIAKAVKTAGKAYKVGKAGYKAYKATQKGGRRRRMR